MCLISDKIKFCTCLDDTIEIEELNHYWVLNRFNYHKDIHSIGTVMPPFNKFSKSYLNNQLNLSNALLIKESFDKQINFEENDRLQITLNNKSDNYEDVMKFDFEYKSGKWHSVDEDDPFYVMDHFDEIYSGEIKESE